MQGIRWINNEKMFEKRNIKKLQKKLDLLTKIHETTIKKYDKEIKNKKDLLTKTHETTIKKYDKEIENKKEKLGEEVNKLKELSKETPVQFYNPVTAPSKLSIKYWKYKYYDKVVTNRVVLINMELNNGFHRLFLALEGDNGFKYRQKQYIFDNVSKYYCLDAKLYCYDFHENITIPIQRKIPVEDIKKAIEVSKLTQVENAINPATIERFLKAKIAEGIMKGQQIDIWFRKIGIAVMITAIVSVLHLLIFMFKTGMFQSIKVPFTGG